jgi:UDP-glucose 4-epimerase
MGKKQINVLITGSNGLIGSHLYKFLDKNPKYHVRGIDLYNSDYNMDLSKILPGQQDILEEQIRKADYVFHFAASVGVENINVMNSYDIDKNLLPLFAKYKTKVIYSSSSEVYGSSKKPLKETSKIKLHHSKNGYPVQKLMTENLLKAMEIPHITVRFFNVVGPKQKASHGFVIPRFIKNALEDKPINVYQKKSVRCFMDVRDAILLLELLMKKPFKGEVYNVGNPKNEISMLKLAKYIKYITKSKSKINITNDRKDEIKYRIPDCTKADSIFKPFRCIGNIVDNIIRHDFSEYVRYEDG